MKKSLVLVLSLMFLAAAAFAQPAAPQPPRPEVVLVKYLQLTQDQITQWQQIDKATHEAVQPLAEQLPPIEKQIKAALDATAPDPVAVGKLVVSADSIGDQIKALRDGARAKREAVLTPDQKTKLEAFEAAAEFIRASIPQQQGPRP